MCLKAESMVASRHGIYKFIKRFIETGSIICHYGIGRPSKITPEIKRFIDEQMEKDDETTESPCM